MSVYEDRRLRCPHCGHEVLRAVAVSIDGPDNPRGEHQAILDGTFQRWPCEACGRAFRADGPLIYLDFDAKLWIGVFPAELEARWWAYEDEPRAAFERNMQERCPPLVRAWAPGFEIRAVFGLDRLREKLLAHAAGLDDRVLEAYKLGLVRELGPHELALAARPRLRGLTPDEVILAVPKPAPNAPELCAIVHVPRAELDALAAARDGAWAPTIAALSAGPYVDVGRVFAPRPSSSPSR